MTYAPSGALVAAPTAGLPEQVGGERNWDYRYTWIRDGSFSVYALLGLGFFDEAAAFGSWLRDRVEERRKDGGTPLNIMYRVDGSSDLDEYTLDHWEGYRGSSPVRIGNGAAEQLQLDIYGEAMDSIYFIDQGPFGVPDEGWNDLVGMLDWLCENWDQPDEGIWETRGGRKPFVYGRLMSWVALDRAIRMATKRSRPADLPKWIGERDRIYRAIMDKGWNDDLQAFSQFEGSDVLDASNLLMPLVGFIVPNDPKWQSTLAAMDKTLVSDSLVYRYDPAASPDGLKGSEGTFSLCTFWYVDALARVGPAARRPAHLREDAHLRQPRRPLLRGDRCHRRTARQLPPSVHASVADQRRDQPRLPTRPRRRASEHRVGAPSCPLSHRSSSSAAASPAWAAPRNSPSTTSP